MQIQLLMLVVVIAVAAAAHSGQSMALNEGSAEGAALADAEAGHFQPRHRHSYSSKSPCHKGPTPGRRPSRSPKSAAGCIVNYRLKTIPENGQMCVSMRPQPVCSDHCRANHEVETKVNFYCVADSPDTRRAIEMIEKGRIPKFSLKGAKKSLKVNIPESCRA